MRPRTIALVLIALVAFPLTGCGAVLRWRFPEKITWTPPTPFPIGSMEFTFPREEQRAVEFANELVASPVELSAQGLQFQDYEFALNAPLPDGCKPFASAKYKDLAFRPQEYETIDAKLKTTIKDYGRLPDEMAIASALYNAPAFRTTCGSEIVVELQSDSTINGWHLTDHSLRSFNDLGLNKIPLEPHIDIVAVPKTTFEGSLKPTAANLLLSRHRFEIPPNYDSMIADPRIGTVLLTYSLRLENVLVAGKRRDIYAGGIVRIFTGEKFLYLVELFVFVPETSEAQWQGYRKYLDSMRYVRRKSS